MSPREVEPPLLLETLGLGDFGPDPLLWQGLFQTTLMAADPLVKLRQWACTAALELCWLQEFGSRQAPVCQAGCRWWRLFLLFVGEMKKYWFWQYRLLKPLSPTSLSYVPSEESCLCLDMCWKPWLLPPWKRSSMAHVSVMTRKEIYMGEGSSVPPLRENEVPTYITDMWRHQSWWWLDLLTQWHKLEAGRWGPWVWVSSHPGLSFLTW